jgi:hypothetical protein
MRPLVRIVEARQQLDQRGFPGAVLSDQREHFARVQGEAQVTHRPALGARIAEPHVLEHEAFANQRWKQPAHSPATGSPA